MTLEEVIKSKGIKKKYIAEQLGLTPKGFRYKLQGRTQFLPSEIEQISKILSLSKSEMIHIFFPNL
jgi:hypothetical protein